MNKYPVEKSLFDELLTTNENTTGTETQEPLKQNEDIKVDWNEAFEQLESLIGYDEALKIAEVFAGTAIYIPKNIITFKNYHDIRKEYKAGATYRALSVKYGYTETHIRNIVHKKERPNYERT